MTNASFRLFALTTLRNAQDYAAEHAEEFERWKARRKADGKSDGDQGA